MTSNTLYITGAGVSAESGIPTFRGKDGFWTIGSKNYTPQQMATRHMYQHNPVEFLSWYYHRFAAYRNHRPNKVHHWLADKNLITQNIDGLDAKAGNEHYIAIHGRLDQVTLFHSQGDDVDVIPAPWDSVDEDNLTSSLMELFKIEDHPQLNQSYKPYVLLFDEYYTELYRIGEAEQRMQAADRIVIMGSSLSVNITQIAIDIAAYKNTPLVIVDPEPVKVNYANTLYLPMTASEYIQQVEAGEIE